MGRPLALDNPLSVWSGVGYFRAFLKTLARTDANVSGRP